MAIAKMHHFKLYFLRSLNSEFLDFLQDFGDVHLKDLTEETELLDSGLEYFSEDEAILDVREEIGEIESAINLLSSYQEKKSGLKNLQEGNKNYSYEDLMTKGAQLDFTRFLLNLSNLNNSIENKKKIIERIENEILDLKPWIDLKVPSKAIEKTKHVNFITGYILSAQYESLKEDLKDFQYGLVERVGQDDKNSYILAIVEESELSKMTELLRKYSFYEETVKTEKNPAQDIKAKEKEIETLNNEIKEIENKYRSMTEDLDNLKLRYEYLKQVEKKLASVDNFLATKKVSVIEGYVASKNADIFQRRLRKNFPKDYYLEISEADKDDPNVPIELENNKFVSVFEPLTEMYSMPRYNEVDPTPFLAPFYWLFFGMMIADAGYGLLLLIGTYVLLRFNLSDSMRKNIKFFNYLGYSTILWGLIYGSVFGGAIEIPQLIDPAGDYMTVLIISIALGAVHMFLGMAMKAYVLIRDGHSIDAFFDVFSWYMVLIGAIYMILAGPLSLPGRNIAKYVMIAGMLIIVFFTGREAKSPVGRIASGAYNLYGISSWLGDFVSYLRLMALGLAGGFIGVAINMIAGTVASSGIVGIIFAAVIFVGGQLFNLALSALSAYVHTLRLTFVEFFGKFYEGGGKKFNRVRKETKYINIKK
ncbi:V-type ATP synthase subunit I [Neofamilia massiliensis]|uniref:V-type ATP synthase subunit I n=1 Tax=Neofamilia massiliensis TaxID=1673724 RepID=UPI0006BB63F3|nr:V-type ATP synthase subunit I [Neofamilia massiliensis]